MEDLGLKMPSDPPLFSLYPRRPDHRTPVLQLWDFSDFDLELPATAS